jgi:hypothetical protein
MKSLQYMLVTALAVGSIGLVGCKDDGRTAGQKVDDAAAKTGQAAKDAGSAVGDAAKSAKDKVVAGVTPSGSSDQTGMRAAMEGIVQNALDANNFKTMTNHLTDADKKRLEESVGDLATLNTAISQFKKNWTDKYKDASFAVQDNEKVYSPDFVALNATPGEQEGKQGTATVKESHGMPALELRFVSTAGKWRLDIPDEVTGEKVKTNLEKAVMELNADPSKWPTDKTEATRLVSHKILSTLISK